jgi:CDP-paratose 2-epimerase
MSRNYLITGGAGFIGSNYVHRLISRGEHVTIYDNFSREGAPRNLDWLKQEFGEKSFDMIIGDVCDAERIAESARSVDVIVHLAGQVAVTTSVINPRDDFESNALGTFNVLEAARLSGRNPIFIYASTNKVYGGMENVELFEEPTRWRYKDLVKGCPESQPLDFHSPYGCSKGTGDQYVRDYSRIYGLRSVVYRQSCIYGTRQFGVEDQGWVAHFVIATAMRRPISIYGNGKQVRDLLYVQDLIDAYLTAWNRLDVAGGQVFNVGGGMPNTLSIWTEFGPLLSELAGRPIDVQYGEWRPGDQPVFVSDNSKAAQVLGWQPRMSVRDGVRKLWDWVSSNPELFR